MAMKGMLHPEIKQGFSVLSGQPENLLAANGITRLFSF